MSWRPKLRKDNSQSAAVQKLYIASSAFVAAGWPNISAELDELVSLSRLLKVPMFLLEPARSNLRLTG